MEYMIFQEMGVFEYLFAILKAILQIRCYCRFIHSNEISYSIDSCIVSPQMISQQQNAHVYTAKGMVEEYTA